MLKWLFDVIKYLHFEIHFQLLTFQNKLRQMTRGLFFVVLWLISWFVLSCVCVHVRVCVCVCLEVVQPLPATVNQVIDYTHCKKVISSSVTGKNMTRA